ncbi:MAG: alpha/beta fold hydrolase [Gemmatimonadota bacterium]|nr:alpha/beta fold hydrolase [Gemmatimonadota bacterium]
MPRKRWIALALVVAGAGAFWWWSREEPADTRFNGAYRLESGELAILTPRRGAILRYRALDGESHALWPAGERTYEMGAGFSDRRPVIATVRFAASSGGASAEGFTLRAEGGAQIEARRLDLPERTLSFRSGDLALRARVVLPRGKGPFPAIVAVQGSGDRSAVDTSYLPYLFASHGIAAMVYDKRGTGGSEGEYTQNFHVLAGDVGAAVERLRSIPEIRANDVHLAGFSQGGWIAPMAAKRLGDVRSLLIGYGPMVTVAEEDRWGYVHALRKAGFGEDAIRKADRVDAVIGSILDHGEDRWDELGERLEEAEGEAWFEAVKGSDSLLGFLADTWLPLPAVRLWQWYRTRGEVPFIDRLYDPVPTVAALEAPSLWILGGEDHSMPTGWTIDELEKLQEAGRPIRIRVYPEADHGILLFEETQSGRRYLGYPPDYFPTMVDWVRRESGLEAAP